VTRILTFDTTHHALWAEEIAMATGVGAQVIPAPPDAGAGCDLALEVLEEDANRLDQALIEAGVEYGRYR
jgi:hypothetical protein